jgi:MFS family permease
MSQPEPNDPESPDSTKTAYELPDEERPATAAPTEGELEQEAPAIKALDYSPAPEGHDPYAALRIPNYRYYMTSYSVAVIGGQVQIAAIDWELYQRTNSALVLGLLGLVQFLPIALLSLPAGQAADLFDRRKILLVTQLMLAVWGACMAVNSYFLGGEGHSTEFAGVALGILFLNSVTLAFARPSRAAILPHIVPQKLFSNAVTWNSSTFEVASMVGPMIGGFVIHLGGPAAYLLNAVLLLVCFALTLPLPSVRAANKQAPSLASLIAGVKFVFSTQLLLSTMTLDLFAVLLGGATYLMPIFARDILQVGSIGYGCMRAAPAVGAFTMAMVTAHMPPMKHAGRNLLLAVAAFGAATVVFGLSRDYWLSLAMLVLIGAFDNISVVVRHTLVQLLTPDEMRGRVSAVNQVFIGSSNELGGMESGLTADAFARVARSSGYSAAQASVLGPTVSVVLGGVGTLLVVAAIAVKWPILRRLGTLQEAQAVAAGKQA